MKKHSIFLLFILFSGFALSQNIDFKGIHQIEWEEHLNDPDQMLFYKNSAITIDSLQERDPDLPQLTRAVFGYLPDWKRNSAPPYLNYSALSHIALFDFTVSTQGNISGYPAGWPNDWVRTMNKAHANGVKLIMCVVEFNADDIHALINSSTASQNFYQNVATVIRNYNLDGVNIDFEGPKTADRGTPMNNFMQGLSDYIKTNVGEEQEISFAGPAVNWSGWNLPGLVNACDYVFIMGYAYFYNGSSSTGPSAPLMGSSYNLEQTIVNSSNGYGGCDKSKLILGLPYYGNRWQVSSAQKATENATTLASGSSIVYATAKDYFNSRRLWSTRYNDAWTYYPVGDDWYQIWCNDAPALDAKEKLVFEYDLMGTGMWALGYDEEHLELWNVLIANFFDFKDSLMIEDFENGKGYFNRDPNYSGSTEGIGEDSWSDTTSLTSRSGDHSLEIVLSDYSMTSGDWKVRLLSGNGSPSNNKALSSDQVLCFSLRTGQDGLEVAVLIDDENGQLEISEKFPVIGDNQWHTYAVHLDSSSMWNSYSNGNGQIDASLVTLDALMFYADEQSPNRTIYLDAVRLLSEHELSEPEAPEIPEARVFLNYPNPFNHSTTFHYTLKNFSDVNITLFDINGRLVETIVNEWQMLGEHHVQWNADHLPSGLYIARIIVEDDVVACQKLLLVK